MASAREIGPRGPQVPTEPTLLQTVGFPSRASILHHQIDQLAVLIEAIIPANKFYSEKLGRLGLPKKFSSLDDFSRRVPLTVKQELVENQQHDPPYGTNLTLPLDRYTRCHQTSG